MEFAIVDLTVSPSEVPAPASPVTAQSSGALGNVDTAAVAAGLEALRADLAAHIDEGDSAGLRLEQVSVKLTITAEGKVAFVVKGSVEACIEVVFKHA